MPLLWLSSIFMSVFVIFILINIYNYIYNYVLNDNNLNKSFINISITW